MRYNVENFHCLCEILTRYVRYGWTTCLLYQVLEKSIKNQVQFSHSRLGQALLNCLHFQDFIFVEVKKTSFGTCLGAGIT